MTTGERIAKKRRERTWTQNDLAKLMGVNIKSVKDWESDVSLPAAKTLIKLCPLLNVSADYLLCLDHRETLFIDDLSANDRIRIKAILQTLKNLHFSSP